MTLLLHGRSTRSQGALSADHSLAVTDEIFLCRKRVVERKYILSPSYNRALYSPEVERQTIIFQKTKSNPCRGRFQKNKKHSNGPLVLLLSCLIYFINRSCNCYFSKVK